ncbi:MAG: epimerase [Bacteroidetes bacterium]|nr:MAG: epimerase [Bacteroidota bacterium]
MNFKHKILITGGAGFIPSSLAEKLLSNPDNFVVLTDNMVTGQSKNIPKHPNCRFIKADVNSYEDIAPIMTTVGFDFVFHYAAMVGVLRTLENPVGVLDDIKGLQNIFQLCKNTGVKRVYYSSSSEVYGEPVHLPQHEYETPLNSRLPYAVVKNIGECFCRSYAKEHNLPYTILRFFNTYGPKQSPDFVISKFLHAAMRGKDITIYGDGSQTRTFCYIDDNVEFTEKIFNGNLFVNDVVNVGNAELTTINSLVETIIKVSGSKSKIINLPPLKEGDMTRRQPDNSKMLSVLNRELLPLEEGLKRIIKINNFS